MAKLLVTGGAGFIGSNFIRYWLKRYPLDSILNLDCLTYAGNIQNLSDCETNPNYQFVKGEIGNRDLVSKLMAGTDSVVHFAAESHVDRSILDSQIFLKTNLLGTHTLLECARSAGIKKFIMISTDEVYGSTKTGRFAESSPLEPRSPYAVSKASADLLCQSYWITYQFPVIITRCSNNFGPYQFPEKVIPLFITNLFENKKVPVYGKGINIREWIYVLDHVSAIDTVIHKGKPGEIYNIGSGAELKNIELTQKILKYMHKGNEFIEPVRDRLGHDLRYALNSAKIRKLGWKPAHPFASALAQTIEWYQKNIFWWKPLKEKSQFDSYMKKNYKPAAS